MGISHRPRAPAPSRPHSSSPSLINPGWLAGWRSSTAHFLDLGRARSGGGREQRGRPSGMEEIQELFPRQTVSHPLVHPLPAPVEDPAPDAAAAPAPAPAAAPGQDQGNANGPNAAPPGVMMWAPLRGRIAVRLLQALLAAAGLAPMASARDFASVTAFRFLVAAAALQCLWCLALSILYYYALLVGRSYRSRPAVAVICTGDWITGALTFSAACASASITTFLNNDMEACYENHCPSFMSATAMAFLSWFSVAPACVTNLFEVVYKLQRPRQ